MGPHASPMYHMYHPCDKLPNQLARVHLQVDTVLPAVEIDQLVLTELEAHVNQRQRKLVSDLPTVFDPRLLSEVHYARHCGASDEVVQALTLEELAGEFMQAGK